MTALSITCNCATLPAEGQHVNGRKGQPLARRRYQRGSVFVRNGNWVGRWREDEIRDGRVVRVRRAEVLGTTQEIPTKRLARRALDGRLAVVNSVFYRPRLTATFAELAARWQRSVLTQFAVSTQGTMRGHLSKWLIPFFGSFQLREIRAEDVQRFVASVQRGPKTLRNILVTLRLIWKSATAWGYVTHDPLAAIVLPRRGRARRVFFTLDEMRRILHEAKGPYRAFYWLAAEAGLRRGELCGLRVCDLVDLDSPGRRVEVWQTAVRGKIQRPKTDHAYRVVAISEPLARCLAEYVEHWRPNPEGLLFATGNGTPWDGGLVVKRKLHPLLDRLAIRRAGLHAFRHGSETLMDRLNAPLGVRSERFGHSNPLITIGTYTHAENSDHRHVAEKLGRVLDPVGLTEEKQLVYETLQTDVAN